LVSPPADIKAKVKGQLVILPIGDVFRTVKVGETVEVSLNTKDAGVAKERHSAADAALRKLWNAQALHASVISRPWGLRGSTTAEGTIKRYRASWRSLSAFTKDKDVRTLNGDDVHAWAVDRRDREKVSPKSINQNDLVAASSAFKWAMGRERGFLKDNPAAGLSLDEPRRTTTRDKTVRAVPKERPAVLRPQAAPKRRVHSPDEIRASCTQAWYRAGAGTNDRGRRADSGRPAC
jgi:hypothetical protein